MSETSEHEWLVSAGRLRYDHRWFDTRLVEMSRQARLVGWSPLVGAWAGFSADVVRHFAFEELAVFPGFKRHKPGQADVTSRLVDDHEALRRMLDGIAAMIADDHLPKLAFDSLVAAMRTHQDLENHRIDPWLEQQQERSNPGGLGEVGRKK
jgi:hemerythrin HHE cation binding domain-containing protein